LPTAADHPLCVVTLDPAVTLFDNGLADSLAAAASSGFEAALYRHDAPLTDQGLVLPDALEPSCRSAGLRLLVQVDLARFALDHPLVADQPALFAVSRRGPGSGPVDPRGPLQAHGEARARLRQPEACGVILPALVDMLCQSVDQGVAGFCLANAGRIAPDFLRGLVEQMRQRHPDLVLVAAPPGLSRPEAVAAATAGIDHLVSSFGWWDLRASWLVEEVEDLRPLARLVAEVRTAQVRSDNPAANHRAMLAAAGTGCGLMVPLGLVASDPDGATRAVELARLACPYGGEMRRLSGSGAPITALLRADSSDVRTAGRAMLLLINATDAHQPAPDPAVLLPAAGAAFRFEDISAPIRPYEVRLVEGTRAEPILVPRRPIDGAADWPRLVVEAVTPQVAGGDFAVKRVVGEQVTVEATLFADGHEQLAAELLWRAADSRDWTAVRMDQFPNDLWRAGFPLERMGAHEFRVAGWLDRFGGFRRDFGKKLDAGVAQRVDFAEGRVLVERARATTKGDLKTELGSWIKQLAGDDDAEALLSPDLARLMDLADRHPHRILSPIQRVDAERLQARFSSWYELFPRSETSDPARHGTFADVIERLPAIRAMGFDTLYFPPIHPIGRKNRKGPNNSLTAGPNDPGSPYAIGSADGGHTALHPELGSFADFARLIAAAHDHGLEIALDFAIQCAPDHPWLQEHPGWFDWRPDGSIKYAENPPKKYQDIVNVDFYQTDAIPGLWLALRDAVLFWIDKGVKTFRVDNPHTKPLPFWEWMIADVRSAHPDAIFLAEAFTRPAMMYRLAKVGFSQSYTYFTWRDHKAELTDYVVELTDEAPKEFYRPHFFVNTPDINPLFLQTSGRPGFRIRAVLASTLSGLFGVYSGFELCEAAPVPGKEEYLDSEKYQIRQRDWNAPGNIVADITLLNRLRRAHPALQTHLNTRFLAAHDDAVLYYAKPSPDGSDMILVMVSLDPHHVRECDFEVPLWEFGLSDDSAIAVEDLTNGARFHWHGKVQHIRLDPHDSPYRIWRIAPGAAA
jgi:starch synthase (maltosyl-transferring)